MSIVLNYEKKLKNQCDKINNQIKAFGSTYLYQGIKIKEIVFIPGSVTTFGTPVASIITEDNRQWNANIQALEKITEAEDILKENLIKLVEHHKEHCNGPDCGISLYYVLKVAEQAGLHFTDEEKVSFH